MPKRSEAVKIKRKDGRTLYLLKRHVVSIEVDADGDTSVWTVNNGFSLDADETKQFLAAFWDVG